MDRVKLGKTHEWQTPEVQRFHVCSLSKPTMLVLMLKMNFISGLLANHTHNPQEESKKMIQIMLLIQLRIEKTRKCLILYFLSNYQSDRQPRPGEEMRNECWIVGCQIKTRGLLGLPCTAGLSWVLYQIISKFSSYSAFQYSRCMAGTERQVCWTELRLISFCGS